MRTAALLGLALGLALAACDRGGDGPSADENEPAGEVLEAKGEVTAVRAGGDAEERELSAGDPVFADDTVEAAAGAAVKIRLAHNGAVWELNGEARRKVRESVAWSAPEASDDEDTLARREDDESVSAGRHAEDQAAGTRDTAMRGAEREPAPETAKAEDRGAPGAPPPPDSTGSKGDTGDSFGGLGLEGTGQGGGGPGLGASGGGSIGTSSKERREKRRKGTGKTRGSEKGAREESDGLVVGGAPPEPPERAAANRARKLVTSCFSRDEEAPDGKIAVTLTVGEDGKTGKLSVRPSQEGLEGVARCARRAIRRASFADEAAGEEIQLEVRLKR